MYFIGINIRKEISFYFMCAKGFILLPLEEVVAPAAAVAAAAPVALRCLSHLESDPHQQK